MLFNLEQCSSCQHCVKTSHLTSVNVTLNYHINVELEKESIENSCSLQFCVLNVIMGIFRDTLVLPGKQKQDIMIYKYLTSNGDVMSEVCITHFILLKAVVNSELE